MNEGIFTASASKQKKIFSNVTKAKKQIFKNASDTSPSVKEEKIMPSFQQLRSSLAEKTLTPAEKAKREEIAKAMEREHPGMPMGKKMAIATAQAKKVAEEIVSEAVTVTKNNYSWGKMMTVHHGSETSYPLHPEHQAAIKKLRPGMKTTFKDETNSTVHAHREGDTVHLQRPKTSNTLTSLPYHHFDTSEHAKPAAKKPTGEYDRKVTSYLKKKYNEEVEFTNLDEAVKTSHEDPLVTVHDKDGLHTHANLSTVNSIFNTKVKHTDVHKGPVTVTSGRDDKHKLKVAISKHHAQAVKDEEKFSKTYGESMNVEEDVHYCAKHVYSKMFGEGVVVEGLHADPDEQGNIEWYAVQFNDGIKKVFTENLDIMIAEYHGNHKKKKRMTNG